MTGLAGQSRSFA